MLIVKVEEFTVETAGNDVNDVDGETLMLLSNKTARCPIPIFGERVKVTFAPPGGVGASAAVAPEMVGRNTKGTTFDSKPLCAASGVPMNSFWIT